VSLNFVHESLPQVVVFAAGRARESLQAEIARLRAERVMVIAGEAEAELADRVTAGLPVIVRHHEVVMHVPVDVVERARSAAEKHRADVLVSVGGGSATGLAKGVALHSGLPIVAVPTTYAGSEATSVWGVTERSRKTTGTDPRVLPRAIVYDATLTLTLPVELSVASGLNALAHCVDSMWAPMSDPIDRAMAGEGIQALNTGLPKMVADPGSTAGREEVLYGAYLAALAFSSAGSGLHHKICHVLGGMFGLPHAETHAVVLPYVLGFNAPHAPAAARRIADAFGVDDALDGLQDLRKRLDAPRSLRDYAPQPADLRPAVEAICEAAPRDNPAPVRPAGIEHLLRAAWQGAEPR
jgi:alcohol dehydrogenase class IV